MVIDFERVGGTPANMAIIGANLDTWPEPYGISTNYTWGHGYWNASNATTGYSTQMGSMLDNGVRQEATNRVVYGQLNGGNNARLFSLSGRDLWCPLDVFAQHNSSANLLWAGRPFQLIAIKDSYTDRVNGYTIKIDDGVNAVFNPILGLATYYYKRYACRRA